MRQSAPEYFAGQIAALGPAQRTLRLNPGIGQRSDWCRDVLMTVFAADGEVAESALRNSEHKRSIGENKAKIYPQESGNW